MPLAGQEYLALWRLKLKKMVLRKSHHWQRRLFEMFKFKVGDEVLVSAGKDKGKKGKIGKIFPKESKELIESIYVISRPVSVAKVSLICPKCGKQTRIGFLIEAGKKNRICKKCKGILK